MKIISPLIFTINLRDSVTIIILYRLKAEKREVEGLTEGHTVTEQENERLLQPHLGQTKDPTVNFRYSLLN